MSDMGDQRHSLLSLRWLVATAIVAAVAAIAYAAAPVGQDTLVYRYQPSSVSAGSALPVDSAAASLALVRPTADALHLELPCELAGSTFTTTSPPEWLDRRDSLTFNDFGNALYVRVSDGAVEATRNGSIVARIDVDHQPGCLADLDYRDGVWRLVAEGREVSAGGGPVLVSQAWFTGPAATDPRSAVTIETRELGTSPPGVQFLLLAVAVVALLIVSRQMIVRASRQSGRAIDVVGSRLKRLLASVRYVDVAVVLILFLWVILIPVNLDDGWIAASARSYDAHGDFSAMYTEPGAVYSFGYWVVWLQHLWLGIGSSAVVERLPALALGVGTWAGLRSIGRRFDLPGRGGSVWFMAAVFVVGFGAWGVTLRPEPLVAVLVVLSTLFAIRFSEGTRGWLLVAWAVVIALALTSHTAGIIVLAPVIASWSAFRDWIRSEREARYWLIVWLLVIGSLVLLVWFVDSNIASKLDSIRAFRASSSHDDSIAEELLRYRNLDLAPYATPMRRMSVAFAALGIGAFLLRARRGMGLINLPARSLVVGLFLLALTPSKWPWHVGGLMGLIALVAALELRKIKRPRWVLAVLGVGAAMSWTWSVSLPWTAFDLRTYEWTVFDPLTEKTTSEAGSLPFELTSLVGWAIAATVVALLAASVLRWRRDLHPPRPPEAVALLGAVLVISLTASTLWSDASDTDGWTFGGQNFASLRGDSTCGLGDEIVVPAQGSLHSLTPGGESDPEADLASRATGFSDRGIFESPGYLQLGMNTVLPLAGMATVGSWTTSGQALGEANTGKYQSDWFALEPGDDQIVLFVMGSYQRGGESELGNAVAIQWGAMSDQGVADAGVERPSLSGFYVDWTMVRFARPEGVDRVRLLLRDDTVTSRESWVASSLPLAVSTDTVGSVGRSGAEAILITPPLAPYFPCVDVAPFERSIIPPPGMIIQTWKVLWQQTYTGALASDRWFRINVDLDPPLVAAQIGAHTGDTSNFLFVSQQYLSASAALFNGEFTLVESTE